MAGRVASDVGGRLVDLPSTSASVLYDLVTIYVVATLTVMRRDHMLAGLLRLVPPARRPSTEAVLGKMWQRLGAYVRAKVIVMLVVGTLMYLALRLLGVRFACRSRSSSPSAS
jgi:predicted PurR-regulated permease PerM